MTQQEGFKTIEGFPNYKIDKHGNVFSLHRGRIIVPNFNGRVARVSLYHQGRKRTKKVHRLVADHFVHNPDSEKYLTINHIDGDRFNNDASNLEWCTHKHNMHHAWDNGLRKMTKYTRNRISKAEGGDDVAAYYNGELIGVFNTYKECAINLNISEGGVSYCLRGIAKQWKGFTF